MAAQILQAMYSTRRGESGLDIGSRHVSKLMGLPWKTFAKKYSNGATPVERTKQILAVMPILPGDQNRDHGPERTKPTEITQEQVVASFVDASHVPASQQIQVPAQPRENNVTVAASIPNVLQRQDTDTKTVEQFVDAKD